MQSFQPTHYLVSRSRRIPVALVPSGERFQIFTEQEWNRVMAPAFELHPKLGVFCKGVQVLGYRIEPDAAASNSKTAVTAGTSQEVAQG